MFAISNTLNNNESKQFHIIGRKVMDNLLREIENDIIRIKTRLRYLTEIEKELTTLAGSIGFEIKNDIIYQMVLDSYDMVVIDLASLCRGMLGKGGFFNQLNGHLKKLKRANLKNIQAPNGQIILDQVMADREYDILKKAIADDGRRRIKEALDEAFDRLFPPRVTEHKCFIKRKFCSPPLPQQVSKVTQDDINLLKDRFEKLLEGVIRDRDAKRAHRYEKRKADEGVEKLSLDKISKEFSKVEQIINDLRALTVGGHFIYNPPTMASPSTTAKDVADLVILGSQQRAFRVFGIEERLKTAQSPVIYHRQFRDEFYLREWRKRLLKVMRKRI